MSEKGFFLLETIVLGAVLLAGISVLGAYTAGRQVTLASQDKMTAAFLAQKYLACRQGEIAMLPAGACPAQRIATSVQRNNRDFYVETSLCPAAPGLMKIEVVVRWRPQGKEQQLTLSRLVRSDG